MEKTKRENKKEKKRGAEYRTRELRLDSLMVSPPTLQRHELGKSVHATFLRTWYHEVGSLKKAIHKQSNTSSRQYR